MKNFLNDVGGSLGIKGFLTIGCLTVGLIGMSYGISTSKKIDVLIEKIEHYEKETPRAKLASLDKINNDMMDKVNDMYDMIKSLETELADDKLDEFTSELKVIKDKIDSLNDEASKDNTGVEELYKSINELKDELTQSQMEISQSVDKFTGTISRRFDQFTGEIEQSLKNVETFMEEIKNELSAVKDEVLNNQSDIIDINNAVYDLNSGIDCLTKRARRDDLKHQTSPQHIVQSNLVESDIKTHSNLVEFTLVDLVKDDITGQLTKVITEVDTAPKYYSAVVEFEDSGVELLYGFHEISAHLDDGDSVLVIDKDDAPIIGITEDTHIDIYGTPAHNTPLILVDTSDLITQGGTLVHSGRIVQEGLRS